MFSAERHLKENLETEVKSLNVTIEQKALEIDKLKYETEISCTNYERISEGTRGKYREMIANNISFSRS